MATQRSPVPITSRSRETSAVKVVSRSVVHLGRAFRLALPRWGGHRGPYRTQPPAAMHKAFMSTIHPVEDVQGVNRWSWGGEANRG
jgi:hypothetical protein